MSQTLPPPLRLLEPFTPSPVPVYLKECLFHHRQLMDPDILSVLGHADEYLSGQKKQELSNWWLHHIEETVDKYLQEKGYDSTCVPYDYLDKPPTSMKLLLHNIGVVRRILNDLGAKRTIQQHTQFTPPTQTQFELIDPLKAEVFKEVDRLCNNLKLVLWDQINGYGIRMDIAHVSSLRDFAFVEEAYLHLKTIKERITKKEATGMIYFLILLLVLSLFYILYLT